MSQVAISGNASGTGTLTIASPNTNSNYTLTLPTQTGTFIGSDSSGYVTNSTNGNGSGIYQGYQYYRLNSNSVGANATGAQNVFGVGVTLVGSTVYEIEIVFAISKTAGTTSHTISFGFGGTATLNNIAYMGPFNINTVSSLGVAGGAYTFTANVASIVALTGAITSANYYLMATFKGTVSVNAGGTFIPQYSLSAAPGGAYTTLLGSYVKIAAIGASGANTSIGTWA